MAFRDRNDRENSRGGFDRDSRGGRSFGGGRGGRSFGGDRRRSFGGNRGGSFGGGRQRTEMHDAICDKCKSECRVPFKPSGDKPVLCSNCFEAQGNRHSDSRSERGSSGGTSGGVSVAQFKELETKVDKILYILENLAEDDDDDSSEEEEDSEGEE